MSKRKNNGAGALSIYEGYEARIAVKSREEYDSLTAKFRVMEENCNILGEDDRGAHFPPMKYSELAKCFEEEPFAPEVKVEVARACYATYLDAYKGKPFKLHITCEIKEGGGGE